MLFRSSRTALLGLAVACSSAPNPLSSRQLVDKYSSHTTSQKPLLFYFYSSSDATDFFEKEVRVALQRPETKDVIGEYYQLVRIDVCRDFSWKLIRQWARENDETVEQVLERRGICNVEALRALNVTASPSLVIVDQGGVVIRDLHHPEIAQGLGGATERVYEALLEHRSTQTRP